MKSGNSLVLLTMPNYIQINILDMIEYMGEDSCQNILSSFVCPLNSDVEDFILTKSIQFAKQKIAISYLVFIEQSSKLYLAGYYTLANKFVCVSSSALSNTMRKKILKFSQYDTISECFMTPMPLIAQLGKNFNPALPSKIPGSDLLEMALMRVQEIENLIGGKATYIECNNQDKLFEFYSAAGFFPFGRRSQQFNNNVLIQMLKYFK